MLRRGDTFLLPRREGQKEHLWVVLTEPDEFSKSVCVNISSYRDTYGDKTTILQPGEHPFIVRKSVVRYADAAEMDMKALDMALNSNLHIVCEQREPCIPELLDKIVQGLLESRHTRKDILLLLS